MKQLTKTFESKLELGQMLKFGFEFLLHIQPNLAMAYIHTVCNGVIQILWFVNPLIKQVSKCRLVPAECSSIYGGSNSFVPLKKPFELVVVESMEVL